MRTQPAKRLRFARILPFFLSPALSLLGGTAAGLTPVRAVEAPPAIYAAGPTQTGRTWEMRLKDVRQVDYLCRLSMGGLPDGAGAGAYYWGCYQPRLDAVVLVDPAAWPSRREWEASRAHEWAHARGWRHRRDGRGSDWAASLPPRGGTVFAAAGAASDAAAVAPAGR